VRLSKHPSLLHPPENFEEVGVGVTSSLPSSAEKEDVSTGTYEFPIGAKEFNFKMNTLCNPDMRATSSIHLKIL